MDRPLKDLLLALIPSLLISGILLTIALHYVNPAPPSEVVISTGDGEGEYDLYAKQYRDILKDEKVNLKIRPSTGAVENLSRLADVKSDVEVGFVQDGLGTPDEEPDLVSLGSLYYEPFWVFYRGKTEITRFSQLEGKRIAVGREGGGTRPLALKLLKVSGIDEKSAQLMNLGWNESAEALLKGEIDVAVYMGTAGDPLIQKLVRDSTVRLMNVDQAEAITRNVPYLHHLVLPHGSFDLKKNIPATDVHLVSPTATLLVKDTLHPALVYLMMKAISQVHNDPGLFEKKNEFPVDKDFQFPLADEAKTFFKSGPPFWQKYLPFWIATLLDRFILILIPLMAVVVPLGRTIPKIYQWRIRSRIYQRYGELKFIETQIKAETTQELYAQHLKELDVIEERVKHMKVPLDFSDHVYGLREHIDFVRKRLQSNSV